MKKHPALALIFLFFLLSCRLTAIGPRPHPTPTPTLAADGSNFFEKTRVPGEVVFLSRHVEVRGQCVEGNCAPGPSISSAAYSWDDPNHRLEIYQPGFGLDVKAKILYGDGLSLSGLAGGGVSQQLNQIFATPAVLPDEITLLRLDPDGTLYFGVHTDRVLLRPGETFCTTTTEVKVQGDGQIKNILDACLHNFGILDQADLLLH